ncbi:hypothetical protein SAMD00019534_106110, partial [Acytostelium subglobosum LB1]|uniref:hypothetical protein n=1 Tax=Acytostelium subglobosum LB1 TaxID=1410327 RepID=UPI000644F41E
MVNQKEIESFWVAMHHKSLNFTSIYALERILSTSLGPKGLDKVIIDAQLRETTITNDGATILSCLPLEHPLAIILKQLAQAIDTKIGDGTTSAVLLACRLIASADRLILVSKLHPNTIITGYQLALDHCNIWLERASQSIATSTTTSTTTTAWLSQIASTSMSSKILANYSSQFSALCVRATHIIGHDHLVHDNLAAVKYLKIQAGSIADSYLVHGTVISGRFASPKMKKLVTGANLVLLDFELGYISNDLSGANIDVSLSLQLRESIENEQREIETRQAQQIIDNLMRLKAIGDNSIINLNGYIVVSTKRVSSGCLALLMKHGINVLTSISSQDMDNVVKVSNGFLLRTPALETKDRYSVVVSQCREFVEKDGRVYIELINDTPANHLCTLVLRGPNMYTIDEVQRSLNDSLSVMALAMESPVIVAGGGATEVGLWCHLQTMATQQPDIKLAKTISMFAESLLSIPLHLFRNAGFDSLQLLAQVKALHQTQVSSNPYPYRNHCINLSNGQVADMVELGVIESLRSKKQLMAMVINTVSMLIRVDQCLIDSRAQDNHS